MDVSTATLLALFVVALVPLMPTEVALIGMGVVAAQQETALIPVILVAATGCLFCDLLLYTLGRQGGARALGRLRRRPRVDAGLGWLSRRTGNHLRPALIVARWLPAGGTAGALLAGSLRWPFGVFVSASMIGTMLWSSYAALLGYLGGSLVQQPGISLLASLSVAMVLGAGFGAVLRRGAATVRP